MERNKFKLYGSNKPTVVISQNIFKLQVRKKTSKKKIYFFLTRLDPNSSFLSCCDPPFFQKLIKHSFLNESARIIFNAPTGLQREGYKPKQSYQNFNSEDCFFLCKLNSTVVLKIAHHRSSAHGKNELWKKSNVTREQGWHLYHTSHFPSAHNLQKTIISEESHQCYRYKPSNYSAKKTNLMNLKNVT